MAIRVKFLKNHGCEVTQRRYGKAEKRFVRPNGLLRLREAVVALKTNDMQLLRLERSRRLKVRLVGGRKHVPLSEVKRLKSDRSELYPGRGAA
jgi:hypothetical protein